MRILHVISGIDPQNGGTTTAVRGMVRAQRQAGLDASILATWREPTGPPSAERFRAEGIPVRMVGRAIGKLSWHPRLRSICRAEAAAADVVHVHGIWEEIQHRACVACRRLGRPYVITPHGLLAEWNMAQGSALKRAYLALRLRRDLAEAAAFHFTTPAERDSVARLRPVPRSIVEPLGLDLAEFAELPPGGFLRQRHPELQDRRVLLFFGRVNHKKGLDILIPAFAAAVRGRGNLGDWRLVLAGPDADGYGDEVRRLAREGGVADRLLFTGMLHGEERIAALVDGDLFVLSSHTENFGIAVIEAMAAGLPVLISDAVNIAPTVAGSGGGQVLPLNIEAWGEALASWMTDPARRDAAGQAARAYAFATFGWEAIGPRWADRYAGLLRKGEGWP